MYRLACGMSMRARLVLTLERSAACTWRLVLRRCVTVTLDRPRIAPRNQQVSQIEIQHGRLRSGHANHDLLVVLVLVEHVVTMLRNARHQAGAAAAAGPALTGARHRDAAPAQRLENADPTWHLNRDPSTYEPDGKRMIDRLFRLLTGPEVFEMHAGRRPMPRAVANCLHQRTWPATIEMPSGRPIGQYRRQIEGTRPVTVVVMKPHAAPEGQ